MLNLDVATDKIADLKKLFNEANICIRVVGKSSDGLITTIKCKNESDFDKAKELVASGVLSTKVAVQGKLVHASPIGSVNIGDSHIDWLGDMGSPVDFGATINGDAFYASNNNGYHQENYVVLTETINPQLGSMAWEKAYDYLNKNILVKATTYSGEGNGADGITFFFGSTSAIHSRTDANGALAVYIDEWDDDTIKVYINGSLQMNFYTNQILDNATFRSWTLLLNSNDKTISIYMNNAFQVKVDISSWTPGGSYIGVSAVTVGLNNYHLISQYQVMGANPWLAINK